jgi:hypothetical protein
MLMYSPVFKFDLTEQMNEKLKFLLWTIGFWFVLTVVAILIGVYVATTLIPAKGWGVYARINQVSNMTDISVLVLSFGIMCWVACHVHDLKREIALLKQSARQS